MSEKDKPKPATDWPPKKDPSPERKRTFPPGSTPPKPPTPGKGK